jgi:hypothetical protein
MRGERLRKRRILVDRLHDCSRGRILRIRRIWVDGLCHCLRGRRLSKRRMVVEGFHHTIRSRLILLCLIIFVRAKMISSMGSGSGGCGLWVHCRCVIVTMRES